MSTTAQTALLNHPEFTDVQRLVNLLSAALKAGPEGTPEQTLKVAEWQYRLDALLANPLNDDASRKAAWTAIHDLSGDVYCDAFCWPSGDFLFDPVAMDNMQEREALLNTIGHRLAAYDATKYMGTLAALKPEGTPLIIGTRRFAGLFPTAPVTAKEVMGLCLWELADITDGDIAMPTPNEAFDPFWCRIDRVWQGDNVRTMLTYGGQPVFAVVEEAEPHALAGGVPPTGDNERVAQLRRWFYAGDEDRGVPPMEQRDALENLLQRILEALSATDAARFAVSAEKQARLQRVYDTLDSYMGGYPEFWRLRAK